MNPKNFYQGSLIYRGGCDSARGRYFLPLSPPALI